MKKIISLVTLLISLCSYGQINTESWYKIEMRGGKGYLHYRIQEDSLSINTTLNFKFKVDEGLMYYEAKMISDKDPFLTIKSFTIEGTTDNPSSSDTFTISGTVTKSDDELHWDINNSDSKKVTKNNTIADWNLYYVLTTLDYSAKGKILEFNSIEISEVNYKENHFLEYTGDEIVVIDNKEVLAKKITHNGDGIGESSYYLDSKNNLIKISIDNSKNYIKCNKEDIDFTYFK